MKRIVRSFLKVFGYEIRRINTPHPKKVRVEIEPRPLGAERDEAGYDKVWSDEAFVAQYRRNHMERYQKVIGCLVESNVIDDLDDSASIADIGCGPGTLLALLAGRWPDIELHGFDFSNSVIDVARLAAPSAEFYRHDIYKPLGRSFDVVLCCETLEHLLHPGEALENVLGAARLKCLVTVPDGRQDQYSGHINFWSEESWGCFLENWASTWDITPLRFSPKTIGALMLRRC